MSTELDSIGLDPVQCFCSSQNVRDTVSVYLMAHVVAGLAGRPASFVRYLNSVF